MERFVSKFGGSSLADGAQITKVKAIIDADPRRRIIVVSAPGKRHADETKITDLLYLCHEMAAMSTDIGEPFGFIRQRFAQIIEELNLDAEILSEIDLLATQIIDGCSRDFTVSRGEYFCARLLSQVLNAEFIDPADCIVILANGAIAPESYDNLKVRLAKKTKRYVMAGFYGRDCDGHIKTFSRGGSDISGAIAARAAGAILYENWTDTSGILMADPRIVENPKPIEEISFREIREMSYMGASVFHEEAILPVREAAIPIHIKNTNRPEDPGTLITPTLSEETITGTEIAGIAGRTNLSIICLEKSLMNREVGFVYRLLGILNEYGVSFEQCPSSIDTVSVIVEDTQLQGLDQIILEQIRRRLEPDSLTLERNLALIAVVGEGMVHTIGIAGKIFNSLGQAGINVRVINQGASEMNIIIGVSEADYKKAVRTIYTAFLATGSPPFGLNPA
jgi:aspartate kinase